MKELELKKPITAHGETLSVLEFDEPTGKDVRELGYPRWCWRRPGLITRRVTRTLSGVMPLRIPALCR